MGRSCTSIDRPNKDEFWDGMTNPAMDSSKEDINAMQDKEKVVDIVSSPSGGPASIPLTSIKGKVVDIHRLSPSSGTLLTSVGNNTTVISVRGSGAARDNTTDNDTKEDPHVNSGHNERTKSVNKEDIESPVS